MMASIFFIRPLAPDGWNRVASSSASFVRKRGGKADELVTIRTFHKCFRVTMTQRMTSSHSATAPAALGSYPTPVERLAARSTKTTDLWVKRDDLTNAVYGGNKVRKLERLLAIARARRAERVVTVGAAGSHHVLATAYFGREAGLAVDAVLFPQPVTEHVQEVLRAGMGLGLRAFPVRSLALAPMVVASRLGATAHWIPPGGSNVAGALGYVDAAHELASQVRRGELPEPDWCVTALGSGGTAAGLAAGFAAEGLKTRVVGVCILRPVWLAAWAAKALAQACARRIDDPDLRVSRAPPPLRERLLVDARFVGKGYGHPTLAGEEATRRAERHTALRLDPTYTAKAFACALGLAGRPLEGTVLYWHTLSGAPMQPLVDTAPRLDELGPALRRLVAARRPPKSK
jgi:1-aminocyclopropane-1-carboxylate deaminase/D-cysteine desulfhydrase-like pyridoxal-dependent ACC family enzyme